MYLIIQCFLVEVIVPNFPLALDVYEQFINLANLVQECRYGTVTLRQLRRAVKAFYASLRRANLLAFMHRKFHWIVHLAAELARFGFLIACWMLERKHKDPLSYVVPVKNFRIYSRALMEECLCQGFANLQSVTTFDFPIRPSRCTTSVPKDHCLHSCARH